ncbi:hypothetical protein AHAS_Ahas19G0257600 [Arachis hypogaea]|uniref:Retrotransposon Copia-like N-terminal domain-containing protein n=1 Tax=Arachis hypogaea TaxID=3818 RepID=A0A444XRS7_ARAHY|nr:hypothetical protein Ahy_B09g098408 [Arachis hypogaea]
MKLDSDSFLQWKDQVEAMIEGNDLLNHITGIGIPLQFLENGGVSPEFQRWKRQDALLKSWLLASMTKPYITRMVGCMFTYQIWNRLETHFASQIKARIMQLRNKLSTTHIGLLVNEYVLSIKGTIGALVSVGETVSESDHVNALLHSLTEEYAPLLTSLLTRPHGITVGELEVVLFANEAYWRGSEKLS